MQFCMPKNLINWNHWRTFVAILDFGSLSDAARHLSITQPTAGRHVDQLEQEIGSSLFTRSRDGLAPTMLALSLQSDARSMHAACHALTRTISRKENSFSGIVRITASEIVGTQILPEMLAEFQCEEPGIDIELVLKNVQDNLLNRDADIAIRLVRPSQQRLLTKKIGTIKLGLYAHINYAKKHPLPTSLAELPSHRLIGIDRDLERWSNIKIGDLKASELKLSLKSDSDIGQFMALKAGGGIGICQRAIASRDDKLIAVLADQFSLQYEMWLTMHEDLKRDLAVRAVFKYLASALSKSLK